MTAIKQEDLIQSIADAFQYISYYHPLDYIKALGEAYEREESPAAKDAIAQILTNSRMAAEGHRPICQDTGIGHGDMVKVSSKRGFIKAVAVVTKRIVGLQVDGRTVHTVGLPNHWGFVGVAKPGYLVNTLTPFVGDANTQTPEYKSFTVNIEKA